MSKISVISKLTGVETTTEGSQVTLSHSSIVELHLERSEINHFARSSNDLVITLNSGETITIKNFYVTDAQGLSQLVLEESNGALWWVEDPAGVAQYESIASTDALIAAAGTDSSTGGAIWPWVLGAVAVGGGVALAAGGGGGDGGSDNNGNTGGGNTGGGNTGGGNTGGGNTGGGNTGGGNTGGGNTGGGNTGGGNTGGNNPDTTAPAAPVISGAKDDVGSIQGALTRGQTTDDTRPTFSGTAEAGAKVTIYDNGKAIGTVTAGSDGKWSFTPSTGLSEGSHSITTTATDAAGNTGPASPAFTVVIDTTPPATPGVLSASDNSGTTTVPILGGQYTHAKTPVLSGKGEPGDTITLYDKGVKIGETKVDANGNWSFTPGSGLSEGSHSLTITATDPAGNTSGMSGALNFIIDTQPPATPVAQINGAGDQITGTAEAGSTVTIKNAAGTVIGSTVADATGHYTIALNPALANGEKLSVIATDEAGNNSTPASLTAPDTTPPQIPTGVVVNQDGDHVTGKAEAGSTVVVKDQNGQPIGSGTADGNGNFDVTISPPQKNGEILEVTATDGANNTSQPAHATAPDTTPPAAPTDLAISDDGTTLTGKAEAGSTVTVSNGTTTVGTVKVDDQGNFSVKLVPSQANGETLTAQATDPAGNTGGPASIVAPDITPAETPVIIGVTDNVDDFTGSVANGGVTNDSHPTIYGTGEAGTTLDLYTNGNKIGSTVVQADGTWSFPADVHLVEGGNVITAKAVDGKGQESGWSASWTITVDTQAPNAPSISEVIDDAAASTGNIVSGQLTNDTTPTFNGTGEPGATINIVEGGVVIGTALVAANGSWTWTPSSANAFTTGTHNLSFVTVDAAGNHSTTSSDFVLNLSTVAPDKPTIGDVTDDVGSVQGPITSGTPTDDTRPLFEGTTEAGSTVAIYDGDKLLGNATVDASGNWSFTPPLPLGEGSHQITAVATNAAGNTTTSDPFEVVIDTIAPDAPSTPVVTVNPDGVDVTLPPGQPTRDTTPTLSGTGTAGDIITIYNGNTVLGTAEVDGSGNWTWTPETPLPNGTYNITLTATDKDGAGNESAASHGATIIIDTDPPATPSAPVITDNVDANTGVIANNGTTNDPRPVLSGTGTAGDTITIYDDYNGTKGPVGTATVDINGNWSFQPSTLGQGDHTFTTTAKDEAGNVSASGAPITVTVDTLAPAQPSDITINVQGTTLSGTAEAGSTVEIRDANNNLIGTGTADSNNHFSIPLTPPQTSGNNLTVTAEDQAGNTSDPTSYEVTGTVQPPTIDTIIDDVGVLVGDVKGSTSDDTLPVLNGTAAAGSTVTIYQDGAVLTTITLGPTQTTWSFELTSPLLNGQHTFTATATVGTATSDPSAAATVNIATTSAGIPVIGAVTDDVPPYVGPLTSGQWTNDSNPTLSGTAGVGDIITIYDNNVPIGVATGLENGAWSFTPGVQIDGAHSYTITVTHLGIPSAPSLPFVVNIDTTAPDKPTIDTITDDVPLFVGGIDKNAATNDTTPTLNGTAEAGSTVTISDNGAVLGTAVADGSGSWTFTPSKALPDGPHNFTVVATDALGNQSTVSDGYAITISTTPPAQPTLDTVADDVQGAVGNLTNGQLTNDSLPTLSGTGTEGNVIHILDNGVQIGTAIVTGGAWSFTPTTALGDGVHNLRVYASDDAGNVSTATPAFAITVDATPPADPVVTGVLDDAGTITGQIAANGRTDDSRPTLSGTGEAGSTIHIRDGATEIGTAVVTAAGTWTFTPTTALGEGSHTLTINATDPAGNTSTGSATVSFTVDTSAPLAPVVVSVLDDAGPTVAIGNGGSTNDATPTFGGSAEANALIVVYDNGKQIGQISADGTGIWNFTPTALTEGSHSFTFTATDAVGNTGPASSPFVVVVDLTPPAAPAITQAVDDVGAIQGPLGTGQLTDDAQPLLKGTSEPLATINIYEGTQLLGTTTADISGNWSLQLNANLSETTHSLTAVAVDAAGNASDPSAPFLITVDTTPPAPPVILTVADDIGPITGNLTVGQLTDDSKPTLSGTAVAGSVVRIYDGSTLLGSVVATNGSWSFTPTTPLADGSHTLRATASDPAGNVSGDSNTFTLVVDATAPTAPTITSIVDDVGTVTGPIIGSNPTNDTQPTLNGTAEANSVVRIYDGATLVGQVTADANGNWTLPQTTTVLTNGQHNFTVTATDAAGNTSAASAITSIVVDTIAPLVPGGLAVVNVGTRVTGTAEAGSTVTITTSGGTVLGTATADGSGNFTATISPAQTNGETLLAFATDKAGNAGLTSSVIAPITALPGAPVITTVTDDFGTVKGTLSNGQSTDDNTPTLTGTAQAGSTVTLFNNGVSMGTVVADVNGNWSFTAPALSEGSHAFTAIATNGTGTGPVSGSIAVVVDTTAPGIPTGTFNADGSVLTGQAEAGSTVTIRLPDGTTYTTTANASGVFTLNFANKQTEGGILTLNATDAAGNTSLAGQVTAPNLPLSAANNLDELNFTTTATVTDAQYSDYGLLLVGAVGNVLSLLGDNSAQVTFTVDPGASANININAYGTGAVLSLLNTMQIVVQHWDATNNVWTTVVDSGDGSTLNLLTLGANGVSLNLTGLAQGQYRVLTYNTSLLATGAYSSLDVDVTQTSAGTIVGSNLNVAGNVITDNDTVSGSDNAPSGTLVTQVTNAQGQVTTVNATGTTVVHGLYGDLTINANGSYTYTLTTTSASANGRTENFTYTIAHNGATASAQLVIQLGTSSGATVAHATAVDDAASFVFDTSVHAIDNGSSSQGGFTVVGVGLGNVLTLDVLSDLSNPIIYNVDQGTTRTMTLQASVGGVAIGSVFDLYVYKFNAATQTYQQYRYDKSWLTAPLLGGTSSKLTLELPAGQYLFLLNTASGITALTAYTLNVLEDHVYTVSSTDGSTSGNVMADDILPTGITATVTEVNGVQVATGAPTTIQGLYGTLTIDSQGNYSYALKAGTGADKISTPDTFVYTITDSTGHKDSASLNITPTPHALDAINDVSKLVTFDAAQHVAAWSDTSVGSASWTTALLSTTRASGSGTFVVDPNTALHNVVLHFDISSLLPLGGLGVTWSITLQGSATPIASSSFTGGSTTINLSNLDLDAGTYTLSFTGTAGPVSVGGITITPYVTGTSVSLNNFETTAGHLVTGNIYDGTDSQGALDQLSSVNTRLSITGYDGHVTTLDPYTTSNASASIVGHYGTLSLSVDGSYTYTLNSGISLATMTSKEVFNYTLTAANGQTDNASLTINLSPQMISTNHNDTMTGSVYGDTLIYNVLDTTAGAATGGNGSGDHWTNFSVSQGDKIDIGDLLVGWNGQNSTLGNYVSVTTSGNNTVISIDRDGTGSAYAKSTLVTLDNVQTTFDELVNQHHNIIT
ncbi:BapA/Bap/LapF family large adhesin [Enterobacter soli]|uniref:BapA/Bap/LapF family large adhesin n=1 Tax=Enterobacter soli TaxID=885040 RepID=UPI0034CE51E7